MAGEPLTDEYDQTLAERFDAGRKAEAENAALLAEVKRLKSEGEHARACEAVYLGVVKGVHGALTDARTVRVPGPYDEPLYDCVMQIVRERDEARAREARLRDYLMRSDVCGDPSGWWLSGPIIDGVKYELAVPRPSEMLAALASGESREALAEMVRDAQELGDYAEPASAGPAEEVKP